MHDILSQISSVIIAGINIEDQKLFDGVKNLTNRSIVYPKSRFLQIVLDPQIIAEETSIFMHCADIKFSSIRHKLIENLSESLGLQELALLLKAFVNCLLDNNTTIHCHSHNTACDVIPRLSSIYQKVKLLYEKCQALGLPYGYLNIYPPSIIKKLVLSKGGVVLAIIRHINTAQDFKNILSLSVSDYTKALNIIKIIDVVSRIEKPNISSLLALPTAVVEIITDGLGFYKSANKLTMDRINMLLEVYKKQPEIFVNLVNQPLLAKLFMTHSNFNTMSEFLKIIEFNKKRIAEITSFDNTLSAFIFSYISNPSLEEDIRALINLSRIDFRKSKKIMSHAPIIKRASIRLKTLCEVAINNPELFNLLIGKHQNNLELLEYICKKDDIFDTNQMIKNISSQPYANIKELFDTMHKEYEE